MKEDFNTTNNVIKRYYRVTKKLLQCYLRVTKGLLKGYSKVTTATGPWVHGATGPRAQGLVGRTVDSKRLLKDYKEVFRIRLQ